MRCVGDGKILLLQDGTTDYIYGPGGLPVEFVWPTLVRYSFSNAWHDTAHVARSAYNDVRNLDNTAAAIISSGTIGICLSGSYGAGLGLIGEGCIVESGEFSHIGLIGTVGGGGQSPSVGIGLGVIASNAQSPAELGRPFAYANASGSPEAGPAIGGSTFGGAASPNKGILGCEGSLGLGADIGVPFGFCGGLSDTWTRRLY